MYAEAYPLAGSPTKSILAFGVVCQERHATSTLAASRDLHRHAPTVASDQLYWNKIAKLSLEKYNWPLNAAAHDSYHTMFAYVRDATLKKPLHEQDATPYFSSLHPTGDALAAFLKASSASHSKRQQNGAQANRGGNPKRERLPSLYEVVKGNNLRTAQELQARACAEAAEGRTALAEYCTKNGSKLQEIVANVWGIVGSPEKLSATQTTLLQKLAVGAATTCTCKGCWAGGAEQILMSNMITPEVFCAAVRRALELGAKRGSNLACVGERGCGKSALLEPLERYSLAFRSHRWAQPSLWRTSLLATLCFGKITFTTRRQSSSQTCWLCLSVSPSVFASSGRTNITAIQRLASTAELCLCDVA